ACRPVSPDATGNAGTASDRQPGTAGHPAGGRSRGTGKDGCQESRPQGGREEGRPQKGRPAQKRCAQGRRQAGPDEIRPQEGREAPEVKAWLRLHRVSRCGVHAILVLCTPPLPGLKRPVWSFSVATARWWIASTISSAPCTPPLQRSV